MKKITFIALLFLAFSFTGNAQKAVVGLPYSFTHNNVSLAIDNIEMPTVDKAVLLAEDDINIKNGAPMRTGIVHHVGYTFDNCGRTDILPNGAKLWRLELTSKDALSMDVHFSHFNIPEGAKLYIYSGDRSQLTGTYTNADIQESGVLVSEDIDADNLIIEYYEPADVLFHGSILLDKVIHRYRGMHNKAIEDSKSGSGDCHYNVSCPVGDNWRDEINSVVRIEITCNDGTYLCSGAMINNVRRDKTPYVLSANHCLNDSPNSCTFKFYFKYESISCDNNDYGFANRRATGGSIISTDGLNYSSDFLLLKITGNLNSAWRDSIVFAGWDASGAASVGAAIHHPQGDFKKISFPKTVTSSYSYPKYWNVSWYVNPNKGCTEQGSSGSPLFNSKGLIIGDLSTGSSACDSPWGTDNYGKISNSWTNSTSVSNKQLKKWLDPDNTGTLILGGMRYNGTPTGVEDHMAAVQQFRISPNPTTGNVTFQANFNPGKGVCNVYNTMGMLVASYDVTLQPSFAMNFNELSNGVYLVEIIGKDNIYKSKMVIAR